MWWNLLSDDERQNSEFIYNLSYGKDSFAGLHVTIDILGIPVHRVVHAEVWATDTIPADLPPMVEFKRWADRYIKGRWGLTVEHICATRNDERLTYEKLFYHIPKRKGSDNPNRGGVHRMALSTGTLVQQQTQSANRFGVSQPNGAYGATATSKGQFYGFPISGPNGGNWCTQLKTRLSQSPQRRGAKRNIVHLLGIAADEPERIARYINKPGYLLPLVEADWYEDLCGLWSQYEEALSPVYESACRSGCWFCHNQGIDQLRLLRRDYPDLWELLLKWDLDSPVTFKADGHTVHDFDRRFAMEDSHLIPTDRTFRWKMLDEPPRFVAYEGEQLALWHREEHT